MDLKQKLDDSEKNNYIMRQLAGSHPDIITKALDYFQNKDMVDVRDEIEAFINNDFSDLTDDDRDDDMIGEISLDKVRDVLSDIDSDKVKNGQAKSNLNESIGRNLKPLRATGGSAKNPDTAQFLNESIGISFEEDVGEALHRIQDYGSIGYRFK